MVSTNEERHSSGVKPQLLPLEPHQWSDGRAIELLSEEEEKSQNSINIFRKEKNIIFFIKAL